MPRKSTKKERFNYASLPLSRTVGLEVEGYMRTNPMKVIREQGGIPYCQVKRDGSLRNYHWQENNGMFGVEIVTEPLDSLAPLEDVFKSITSKGWAAVGKAGLHIHVDAGDYTFSDRVKFIQFAKKIEDVIFLFVKNRRYNNRYCKMIPQPLIDMASKPIYRNCNSYNNFLAQVAREEGNYYGAAYVDRYQWLNIFNSSHNTIEFRLFHPIRSAEDGAMFAYFVHNLVNTVKNCTPEQLAFIAQSVEEESNIQSKARKLLDAIGVPYDIPIVGDKALNALSSREQLKQLNRERALASV